MIHLFYQEYILNKSVYIPKSDEIDWEIFIQNDYYRDKIINKYNEIDITNQWNHISLYDTFDEYKNNNPNELEYILHIIYAISKQGVSEKYLKYNHPTFIEELFESEDMVKISFIGIGLLVFFAKGIFEYFS